MREKEARPPARAADEIPLADDIIITPTDDVCQEPLPGFPPPTPAAPEDPAQDPGERWPLPAEQINPLWSRQLSLKLTPRTIEREVRAWSRQLPDSKRRCAKGLLLEFVLIAALRELGFAPWAAPSPQSWLRRRGKGPDAIIAKGVQFEAKNWRPSTRVTAELAKDEILSRFSPGDQLKILVVSSTSRWTPGAIALLETHGIIVLKLGFVVSNRNIGRAVALLKCKLAQLFGITGLRFIEFFRYILASRSRCSASPPHFRVVASGKLMPSGVGVIGPPIPAMGGAFAEAPRWPFSV
jgi:hypothetical protein